MDIVYTKRLKICLNHGASRMEKCKWTWNKRSDVYDTDCGNRWVLQDTKNALKINELNYCVFCGKPIDVDKDKSV